MKAGRMNSLLAAAFAAAFALGLVAEAAAQAPPAAAVLLGGSKAKSKAAAEGAQAETAGAATAAAGLATDAKVLGDIDDTLNELSNHLKLSPRRLRVSPPATRRAVDLPASIELVAGKSQGIDLPGEAREVVVGNTQVADVTVTSRRRIFIIARQAGHTNVAVLDASGATIAQVEVTVGANAEAARAALARQFPDEALEVVSENGALVLSGQVRSDALAGRAYATVRRFVAKDEDIVNLIKISREQQVLLQVRVAEVQRNILKEIGVRSNVTASALNLSGTTANLAATAVAPAGTFLWSGIKDALFALDLLEQRGLVRSLAEPNMVAVSGETATMLAGGEYPIPVPDSDGIKIEYKPFGVTLSFLPVVLDAGKISLKLTTEVSALSSQTVQVPTLVGFANVNAFTVRRASSTVELPSGGSLMIAGLIQNDMIAGLSGLPGIMDVPVLGRLFRSDSFQRNETELVVMVTASMVRPTAPNALLSPTEAMSPGGDLDTWLFGRLTGTYSSGFVRAGKTEAQPLRLFGYTIDEFVP
jgi:pilus assembly protein CpaC